MPLNFNNMPLLSDKAALFCNNAALLGNNLALFGIRSAAEKCLSVVGDTFIYSVSDDRRESPKITGLIPYIIYNRA